MSTTGAPDRGADDKGYRANYGHVFFLEKSAHQAPLRERGSAATTQLGQGAKKLTDIVELQAAYWRKQFDALTAQAEKVRTLSTK